MCLQITYTLACEHVKTQIIFCADAVPAAAAPPPSSSGRRDRKKKHAPAQQPAAAMVPCRNLTQQSQPYPTPPSFAGDPQTAATSLLAPKCPLADCPFEAKNRCWNCCWCGKGWNERGRCSCIMIIEGNRVQCEHICCPECEAAA